MSQEDTCKPRFKGIENFLRRIAFNLGNSPSQTEVKIISCIPIDVTDLQQKILLLEKELSDAKKQKSAAKHKIKIDCNRLDRRVIYDSSAANQSVAISQCDNSPSLDYTLDQNFSNVTTELSSHSKPLIEAIYERAMSEQTMKSKWDKRKFNANKCVKNIFRKRKKQTQNRGQTQFVYYAHTDYGPNLPEMNKLSYSYLSDVFRKHYDPKLVLRECSDTSHFSEPVCRDLSHSKKSVPYDSEVCSCCHGRFQNVDIYMNDEDKSDAAVFPLKKTEKVKNEPSIVDLLPVKERSTKKKPNSRNDNKLKIHYNINNAEWSLQHDTQHTHCYNYAIDNNREFKVSKQTKCKNTCQKHTIHSKAGHREATNIYKGSCTPVKIHKNKVEKSLKENISSIQIKTAICDCTKTEAMLNEIKKMLRTVLNEIKTNTETRYIKDDERKRDAVIQNDSSGNDMQRSTFLHSFMYNTSNYCTNPYLLPFTGQVPLTQYCFSNMPLQPIKCPTKEAPQSALCPKSATTRSTNTDNVEIIKPDNKETGELIKEIYKSIKTSADNPSNAGSSNDEIIAATNDSTSNTKINRTCRDVSLNVSNVKKDAQVEALLSCLTSYTASNVVCTAIAPKSGFGVKENDAHRFTKHDDISEEDEYTETVVSSSYVTGSTKVPKKTGVLAKMLSVFKKNKSNRDEETEISDTDDYETVYTVYTDKANNTPKIRRPVGINIRVPPSRNKNKRRSKEECRKQWIDELLNEQSRYYAPKNNTQSFKSYPKAVYGRDYEARAAIVVPNRNYNYYIPNRPKYENANKMCRLPIGRKKISYLKNAKLMRCGRDWKKFIMES
ncbi:uncharacterized protein LOC121731938 [Aricia agestis]|uniref:uncharacterized protein LOC121731938 n=1 Tax=Aricia agestis TaxID=91739 RepID=UPI001C2065CF|nr:uncharacterized protein LOC121731938 [Aricia agestis]